MSQLVQLGHSLCADAAHRFKFHIPRYKYPIFPSVVCVMESIVRVQMVLSSCIQFSWWCFIAWATAPCLACEGLVCNSSVEFTHHLKSR